jgi:hypothetical protein
MKILPITFGCYSAPVAAPTFGRTNNVRFNGTPRSVAITSGPRFGKHPQVDATTISPYTHYINEVTGSIEPSNEGIPRVLRLLALA